MLIETSMWIAKIGGTLVSTWIFWRQRRKIQRLSRALHDVCLECSTEDVFGQSEPICPSTIHSIAARALRRDRLFRAR